MRAALIALAIARALDASTTCQALRRGGSEGNPVLPTNCPIAISVQAGLVVGQDFGLSKLAAKHPKLAQVIAWSTVSLESGVAWHNARVK